MIKIFKGIDICSNKIILNIIAFLFPKWIPVSALENVAANDQTLYQSLWEGNEIYINILK